MREAGTLAGHSHVIYGIDLYISTDISLHRPIEKPENSLVSAADGWSCWS